MANRLTKKEKNTLIAVITGVGAWALLYDPLVNLLNNVGISDPVRIFGGIGLLVGIYYFLIN